MNRTIITAIGTDRPGLVDKISSIIHRNNGNIENRYQKFDWNKQRQV